MTKFEYLKPNTVEEASELLVKYEEKAKIFNGGTDLLVRMRENLLKPEYLVDIKAIPSMHDIKYLEGEGLFIGAAVTMNQLVDSTEIVNKYYVLAESAHTVASHQLRNRATLAGNLCNASPLGDTIPALHVLGAKVKIFGPDGYRSIPVEDFILGVRKTVLNKGELVTGIILPKTEERILGTYYKQSRRKDVDLATVGTAVAYHNNTWKVCFAAVAPKPLRGISTEKVLNALNNISEAELEPVLEAAAKEVMPITDVRGSREYRIEMIKVSLKRAVLKVWEEAKQ